MTLSLTRTDLMRTTHLINGQWQPSHSGETFAVHNPADLSLITQLADGRAAEAQQAAAAAQTAFHLWRKQPAKVRGQLLKRWHALILAHQEDLARLISLEQGKPLAEGRGEVLYAASYVEWFAEEASRIEGDVIAPAVPGRQMLAVREPVGVVAVITPWNFPAAMIARKIAPALAAGCTVLAKPAEDTPLTSLALIRLAEEAGIPAGVINLVCASRDHTPEVVDVWLANPKVRKISFTGSTPVGQHLARASATTLKKLSLELGGNAPFIVFDDADLDAAVEGLMVAKFRNGGQTCVCPNRVYVQDGIFEAFTERLCQKVEALNVGPASDPKADIGPMINRRALEKILNHIEDAVAHGAQIRLGGQARADLGPHFITPTVLTDVTDQARLCEEETFGPVVPLFRFQDEADVIERANHTEFGLAAYFYANDVRRIWRLADALETGIVGINEGAVASEAAPFGGIKASGYGREGSKYGLDDYMHIKYLCQGNLA